jgi:Amt family ammonium transporter
MTKRLGLIALLALAVSLVLPGMAFGQDEAIDPAALDLELDNLWIMVACALVFLMQAGFLLLEIGFSRQKNVGAGVATVLVNRGVVTLAWWAVGYGI